MSHITLKDYIKQLENQGYDYNTRVAMAKEWASTHQPKTESVKTDDFTNTPDPDVKSENTTGSDSGSGSSSFLKPTNFNLPFGTSLEQLEEIQNNLDAYNKEISRLSQVAAPGDAYKVNNSLEYKFEINPEGQLDYYSRSNPEEEFILLEDNVKKAKAAKQLKHLDKKAEKELNKYLSSVRKVNKRKSLIRDLNKLYDTGELIKLNNKEVRQSLLDSNPVEIGPQESNRFEREKIKNQKISESFLQDITAYDAIIDENFRNEKGEIVVYTDQGKELLDKLLKERNKIAEEAKMTFAILNGKSNLQISQDLRDERGRLITEESDLDFFAMQNTAVYDPETNSYGIPQAADNRTNYSDEEALRRFKERTGRDAQSLMELTPEDYLTPAGQGRKRIEELEKERKRIEDRARSVAKDLFPENKNVYDGKFQTTEIEKFVSDELKKFDEQYSIELNDLEYNYGKGKQVSTLKDLKIKLKSGVIRVGGTMAYAKTLLNDNLAAMILDDKSLAALNSLPRLERQKAINNIMSLARSKTIGFIPGASGMNATYSDATNYLLDVSENWFKESDRLQEYTVKYDMGIGESFLERDIVSTLGRLGVEGLSSATSLLQASIPYIGIPSIIIGEAGAASREKQDQGEDLSIALAAFSLGIGLSEGVLEGVTRGIAKRAFGILPKSTLKQAKISVLGLFKNMGVNFLKEGGSEEATLILNEVAEALYRDDITSFEVSLGEAVDTFLIGGAFGSKITAAGGGFKLLKQGAVNKKVNKILKNSKFETIGEAFGSITPPAPDVAGINNQGQVIDGVTSGMVISPSNTGVNPVLDMSVTVNDAQIEMASIPGALKILNSQLKDGVNKGEITQDQADAIRQNFLNVQGAVKTLESLNFNKELKLETVSLMLQQKLIKEKIKEAGGKEIPQSLIDPLLQQSKQIDTRLAELSGINFLQNANTRTAAIKMSEQLDVEFENFSDQDSYDARVKEIEDQGGDVIKSVGYGQAATVDGKTVILINDLVSAQDNVYTTDQHEVLHPFFLQALKGNNEAAARLGKALMAELINNKDITGGAGFLVKFQKYVNDPNYTGNMTWDEVIPLVSEALSNGDIQYNPQNQQQKTFFEKIRDLIQSFFKQNGLNIKFNTGKDVFDFLLDYNNQVQKGEGFTKSQLELRDKGATGALIEGEVKLDRRTRGSRNIEQIQQELDAIDTLSEQDKDTIAKESKRLEDSQEVQTIYEQQGLNGAFEIIEKFKPITNRIVESRSQAPNFDRQLLTDEIETGKRGIFDLIREYKPESGVPLAAYINKFLPARAIEASQRVLGEEFTADVTEAKGVIAEEVTETIVEKPTKLTKPSSLLPAQAVTEITEQVKEKIKGVDLKNMTFKKLGDLAPEIIAREIGIPVKKLTDPRANLSKGDATAIQQFVNKNADKLLRILPEGSVTEAATDDILGTSTGVPTGLLKAFYTKGERGTRGAGLAPFVKNKNISKADFLKAFGIVEGKKAEGFNARSPQAQALKGIASLYGRLVTNEVVRSPEVDLKPEAKQRVAAGKSRAMAAKRIKINTKEEFKPKQLTTLGELSSLRNKKQLADKLDFDSPAINEKSRPALQTKMLEAVKTYKLDNAVIEAGVMASGGKQTFYGKKGGKMYSSAKLAKEAGIKNPIKFGKTTDGKFLPINTPGITNWVAKPGRLYYGKSDPAYKDLLKSAKIYDGPKPKKITPSRAFSTNSKKRAEALQESKDNMKVLDHVVTKLADAVADGMPLEIAGDIIIQSYQATGGLIKIAAPFKYRSKVFRYGGPNSKKQQREGKKYREEHNPPASVIGAEIMFAIKNNASKPIMQAIKDNYYQTQLSKFDDALLDEARLDATLVEGQTIFDNPISRLAAAGINLQSLENPFTGKTIAEDSGVGIDPKIYNNLNRDQQEQASAIQNQQIIEGLSNPELDVKKSIDLLIPLAEGKARESKRLNNGLSPNSLKYDGFVPIDKVITDLGTADKALNNARRSNAPVKKIRVFDFDDTLAKSKSMVIVTMPDDTTSKINATQFAAQASDLQAQGAKFDFSEFSKVVEGKKGPLFEVAEKIAKARGTDDIFILTARPANAAGPIQAFMKANGINIPLNNITGLGDGTPESKARWIAGKAAEGYNDFYFADDAIKNVKAVKDVLSQIDVKSKVQQARASKRNTFDTIVNDMIESSSGIESYKTFSAAKARTIGRDKGRFDWLTMSSSAEDFKGLLYRLLGNGKKGEAQFEFLKNNLIDPYNRAEDSIIQAKISASNDFMALKQKFSGLPKTLETETGVGKFTYQHALRVYIWTKQGMSIPGISKADATKLNKFITSDTKLQSFADQLITIQKDKPYPEPGKDWLGGNLTTDIIGGINKVNRTEYQQEWRENVEIIFSPENLNKMEAAYGTRWRKALENTLKRMKAGTNRLGYTDSSNAILDWVNNSVGAVMFLNTRSALLQTISAVNFINWGDNNIIKAGQAFANQKQFWSDFMTLMNSDYLVQRRNGLKINVSESEIADAVKDSQNKPKAAIAFLLSKGFVFTRYADSFAIASGGSTFYRNRIKKYLKEGMDQKLAEQKAFEDFKDVAEESQQSSDPSKISMQQASGAGRVILNWANTPMQYVRIQKRALQDLIAGRGDAKTNISRIAYYGVVQNLIFNALQQALFAIGFGDDDEEDEKKKKAKDKKIAAVANGMVDSQLKGLGIAGMVMVSAKNTLRKIYEESKKKRPEYEAAAIEALSFSPAISSKYRKFVGGLKSFSWNMKEIKEKGFSLDNPAYLAGAQIITAFTNLPIDRVMKKINNIRGILSEQSQMWQKVSMSLGWSSYDVGLPYYGGWDKPIEPTKEEIKKQEFDKLKKDTKTQDQIDMLLNFGLTKKEIRALGKEDDRVRKIIELQNAEVEVDGEKVEVVKPKETNEEKLKRQFDSIKAENKPDQVKTLTKFGLNKKQIRDLKYEKDRVEKILELMNK